MEQESVAFSNGRVCKPQSDGVLQPFPRPRPVGPGRVELGLRRRADQAEEREREALALAEARARQLELSEKVERGAQRRLDRLEHDTTAARAALEEAAQREKRLILALGALQRETELLRESLALAAAPRPALPAARRSSWWRRLAGSS